MQNGKKDRTHSLGLMIFLSVFLLLDRSVIEAGERPVYSTIIPKAVKPFPQTDQSSEKKKGENYKQVNRSKPLEDRGNDFLLSPQEKKKKATQLLDYILANAPEIKPAEYSVLTQVEGATLLWRFDKERSVSILKNAVITLKEITKDNKDINKNDYFYETKGRKLRFLIVRKIAALKPELVKELFTENNSGDKEKASMSGEWTDNARAVLFVASEQIENNTAWASQMAQQAFSLGMANWQTFLSKLAEKDNGEAERFAILLINHMRDGSVNAIAMRNLVHFVLDKARTLNFREYYFQSLVIRLQHDLNPDVSVQDLESDIGVAQEMIRFSNNALPAWSSEFQILVYQFESLFKERSLNLPGPIVRKLIDMTMVDPATPGDTSEISEAATRAQSINDSQARDKEYQKLSTKAAFNADPRMADELISKINDILVRQETSLMVYSPLVRKSVGESDWTQAQVYALRILDPIGLVLVMDSITQAMTKAGVEKHRVLYAYSLVLSKLDREKTSGNVAKAFLLAAKSLINLDNESCRAAVNYAIDAINEMTKSGDVIDETPVNSTLSTWVRRPSYFLRTDEILDLNDTVGVIFTELAKRDDKLADQMAVNLNHQGLRSLARLAVCKALFSEIKPSSVMTKQKKATSEK